MLVLSRKVGEEIVIAGTIRVKVVGLLNQRVRLGIVAPESVTVDREEVHQRKNEFSQQLSAEPPSDWAFLELQRNGK